MYSVYLEFTTGNSDRKHCVCSWFNITHNTDRLMDLCSDKDNVSLEPGGYHDNILRSLSVNIHIYSVAKVEIMGNT